MAERPMCLCGQEMVFLMDNKRHVIWECQKCGRLLLRPRYADWQRWFVLDRLHTTASQVKRVL